MGCGRHGPRYREDFHTRRDSDQAGRLSPGEWAVVKERPESGYAILKDIPLLAHCQMVRQHHEKLDGSGYPRA